MRKIFILFALTIIFLSLFVNAKNEITVDASGDSLKIEPTYKDYLMTNEAHEFEVHVFNSTTGYPIYSGISCYMHLYGIDGTHIFEGEDLTSNHLFDYSFLINESNFTTRGEYQAKFQCNNSQVGGAQEIFFFVNNYGEELSDAESHTFNYSMIFLMILFVLGLVGVFSFQNPASKLACYWVAHILFIVGTFSVWQFNSGYAIGFIGLASIWKVLFYVSTIAMFPLVLLSVVWAVWLVMMNEDMRKMMDRGMDEDEAYSRARSKRRIR